MAVPENITQDSKVKDAPIYKNTLVNFLIITLISLSAVFYIIFLKMPFSNQKLFLRYHNGSFDKRQISIITLSQCRRVIQRLPTATGLMPIRSIFPPGFSSSTKWILTGANSQVIKLPEFPVFTNEKYSEKIKCPHLQPNLKFFNDPSTWPSRRLPLLFNGVNITLPPKTKVLISSCSIPPSIRLGFIFIPTGSSLIFDDAQISIAVRGIMIDKGASLVIGSETCRIASDIIITLYGSAPSGDNKMSESVDKGIVASGTLDIHGGLYNPTWSRLAFTAMPGSTWIFLQRWTNWEIGQSIMIATTTIKDSRDYHENEIRIIVQIYRMAIPQVMAIQINRGLAFKHYAGPEYQAEVSLLSRRITIQGSVEDSIPRDTVSKCNANASASTFTTFPCGLSNLNGWGGHIMIMGTSAIGRISGVSLQRLGQTNIIGRYPIHFHLLGDAGRNSFVQDSSVQASNYRCIVIHGTNQVRISRNSAYDITGHCYYLEDGVEEGNTFNLNFGGLIHFFGIDPIISNLNSNGQNFPSFEESANLAQPADIAASVFYISNMNNIYIGNAASGGWSGFHFPTLHSPIGVHKDIQLDPSSRSSLEFSGNTAHSSGYFWNQAGCIYSGGFLNITATGRLLYNPGRAKPYGQKDGLLLLKNNKVFLCNVGVLNWGFSGKIEGLEVHDVQRTVNILGRHTMKNALLTCRTANNLTLRGTNFETAYNTGTSVALQWYDVRQSHIFSQVTFRNCRNTTWQFLVNSDIFLPEAMQATIGIRYENVNLSRLMTRSTYSNTASGRLANWFDVDGTASLRNAPTWIGSSTAGNWFKMDSLCDFRADGLVWLCDAVNRFNGNQRKVGSIELYFGQSAAFLDITECGNNPAKNLPCPIIAKAMHIGYNTLLDGLDLVASTKITGPINGFGWFIHFNGATPRYVNVTSVKMSYTDSMVLVFQYPIGTKIRVTAIAPNCPSNSNLCIRTFSYLPVDSAQKVRDSSRQTDKNGGNVFFHDTEAGHVYFPVVMQRASGLGSNMRWQTGPFNDNLPNEIAPLTLDGATISGTALFSVVVEAECPPETRTNDQRYCMIPEIIYPPSPCPSGQDAYDSCI